MNPGPEDDVVHIPPGFRHGITQIWAKTWHAWDQLANDPAWEVRETDTYAETHQDGHQLFAQAPVKPRAGYAIPIGPEDFND